jgi:protoporphyrinogen oxidase
MNKKDYKIHIIGAGISGLVAAITLEKAGYSPTILEASDAVGGRVKTDHVEDYQLDHGFQVMLEAYPMARKFLDYQALELQKLLPGALIYKNGNTYKIGDPTRDFGFLWSTITAAVGSIRDKVKIFNLNKTLKNKSLEDIFATKEQSTLEYLQDHGFSEKIIDTFFKPFFTGIFLEPNLKTSSRMFEFVYKMFGEGLAVIPKGGIGEIPEQLKAKLANTQIVFNTKIKEVKDDQIVTEDGRNLKSHLTIVATTAGSLISNLSSQETQWKSCTNLYFKVPKRSISQALIGLVADDKALINNLFYHTSVGTKSRGEQELLSVTVVKEHQLKEDQLIKRVQEELKNYCGISQSDFLKLYHIPAALPNMNNLQYDMNPLNTKLKPTLFLAGDHLLNGSLNAAMISGERAAEAVIHSLEDGLIVENLTSEYL